MAKPGDLCPKCGKGRIRTRSSVQAGEHSQVRYLECQCCDYRSKLIVPAEYICRRSFVNTNAQRG